MTDEERFILLETKISHQDFLVDELNQVIYQQQQQLDTLEKKMSLLIKRVEGAMNESADIREAGENRLTTSILFIYF